MDLLKANKTLETPNPSVAGYDSRRDHSAHAASTEDQPTPDEVDLTDSEVNEINATLCSSDGRKLHPQEVYNRLKAAMPSTEGYFNPKRRLLLLGAVWAVKSGDYQKILQRDGTPLFKNANQFYESLQLGTRQAVSKDLQVERCFRLLPAELKGKVDGPGCLEPLLPLTKATSDKCERALAALTAWGGELSKAAASAAMELSTGPIEPNLRESMANKVGTRKNNAALKSLDTALSRITSEAPCCHALSKQLIKYLAVEKPILVPGLIKLGQDGEDSKPKVSEATAQSGHDKVETKRADIVITPEMVTVTIHNSGRAPDLLMGLVKNKSFGFHKTKKSKQCGSTPQEQKPVWVSAKAETTPAGKMLRAALLTL